jgi:asparagine synthase (glutamine-hydrolysing)
VCGVGGTLALDDRAGPPDPWALERMIAALAHRGPDGAGQYRDERAGLAHTRLSIIDPALGRQPLGNAPGTLWIAFNGEIFNYLELRAELEARGHRFRTRSDTEVIVAAFEAWGEAAFERFNGQWALALWDVPRRRLTLCRDPFGILPLYTCEHRGRLWFASEAKAIFAAAPEVPRAWDPEGLAQVFTLWTAVAPRTVFRGVREVEPGHLRVYDAGGVSDRCYAPVRFPPEVEPFRGTVDEAAEAVRAALRRATRLRALRADVPVGSYLSGGLDSSLVASLAAEARGGSLDTFSVGFEDPEYDEAAFQRLAVAHVGSAHHATTVGRRDIAGALPAVVRHAERPLLRTAAAPLHLLSAGVRSAGYKVVLTGEGADEVFAGYDLFREAKVRRFWARAPASRARPRLLERLYPWLPRSPVAQRGMAERFFGRELARWREPGFGHRPRWETTRNLQRLFSPALREAIGDYDPAAELAAAVPAGFAAWDLLAQDQWLEMRTLLSGYLLSAQGDRQLMAHSVEGRFPFLDPEVVALASSLPARFKLRGLDEKHVLKRAAAGLVPDAIRRRAKQPYRAPDASAFAGDACPAWAHEVLRPAALADAGVFDPQAVERLWEKCRRAGAGERFSNSDDMALVGVLTTQLLHAQLISPGRDPG